MAEQLVKQLEVGIQTVPYSVLQHLAAMCEVEMLNRTMPECSYAEDML